MAERTLVMTGATSGIGAHALRRLSEHGDIKAIIGARATSSKPPSEGVVALPLELSSLEQVRAFADSALDHLHGESIDMLVLNAGAQFSKSSPRSKEGFDLTFAVNHLSHYLLARLLLPHVSDGGRVILTTSDTHDPKTFPLAPKELDVDSWAEGLPSTMGAYAASKLGNLLTIQGLAALPEVSDRHISTIAFNPGLTGNTQLGRRAPVFVRRSMAAMRPILRALSRFRPQLYMHTPEQGGTTLAGLANGTLLPPKGRVYASMVRGELTFPDPSELAQDTRARDELWKRSAEFTGLSDQ